MVVVKSGASGHNIRSKPSLKAAVVGMLALGDPVLIQEYVSTQISPYKSKISFDSFSFPAVNERRRNLGTHGR